MKMKSRYERHEFQYGQRALQEFMDDLHALDVLPEPQPNGMQPYNYMCAANMGALMVTFDDGQWVADIAFYNVPPGQPELLGIVSADSGSEYASPREIGKSLVLDLLYGAVVPAEIRLLRDVEERAADCGGCVPAGDVADRVPAEPRKYFVIRHGSHYEVVRKYMQRSLSPTELQRLKDQEDAVASRAAELAKPVFKTDAEIEAANLDAFFCTLSGAGITKFIGYHDGYDDGGSFDGIRAVRGQKLVELPALDVQHANNDAQGRQGQTSQKALRDVLYDIVDDILSDIQNEYVFGCGTQFQFRCDVATRAFQISAKGNDLDGNLLDLDLVC